MILSFFDYASFSCLLYALIESLTDSKRTSETSDWKFLETKITGIATIQPLSQKFKYAMIFDVLNCHYYEF